MTELDEPGMHDPDMHWVGHTLLDRHRVALGQVAEVYDDADSGEPQWALLRDSADGESVLVPLAGVEEDPTGAGILRVEVTRTQVLAAPRVPVGDVVTVADEERLREHYRTTPGDDRRDGLPGANADVERSDNLADAPTGPMISVDVAEAPTGPIDPIVVGQPVSQSQPDHELQPAPRPKPQPRPAPWVPRTTPGAGQGGTLPKDLGGDDLRRAAQRRRMAAITSVGGAVVVLSGLAARRKRAATRSRIKSLRQP